MRFLCTSAEIELALLSASREMRILFLILASDGPVYTELQSVWRSYIHRYPGKVEAYFYKANPALEEPYKFEGDVLWVKCQEALGSVAKKLKAALAAFENRLDEFDFICRPNLSSFFIMDRYLEAVQKIPRERACLAKEHLAPGIFPTGAGFTITPDIVRAILADPFPQTVAGGDDVAVGAVLKKMGIKITNAKRLDITGKVHWENAFATLAKDTSIFHVRVKHECKDRLELDMSVHRRLLESYNLASQ